MDIKIICSLYLERIIYILYLKRNTFLFIKKKETLTQTYHWLMNLFWWSMEQLKACVYHQEKYNFVLGRETFHSEMKNTREMMTEYILLMIQSL